MAITIVGTTQIGATNNGGHITLTFDTAPQEGDVVYFFGGNGGQGAAAGPVTTGYTQLFLDDQAVFSRSFGVWRKVMGATPDTSVEGEGGGGQNAVAYASIVLRGVDTTTPEDATTTDASGGDDNAPDPPSITTVTDGAWVLACGATDWNDPANSAPTDYVNFASDGAIDTNRFAVAVATREIATAGAEDPGVFSAMTTDLEWRSVTVAVRPASTGTTVTPGVIGTSTTVPIPTATGAAKASPAAVATTTAVPAPSPAGEALTQPGAAATTSEVPTPAVNIGKTVTPDVIATVAALPTPTPLGEALVTVSVIPTTSTVPTPSASVNVTATPAVILTTVTVPTPDTEVAATVTPASIATVSALSTPTPVGGTVVTPALIKTLTDILIPLIGLPAIDITHADFAQFQRVGSHLVLAGIARGRRRGFGLSEGFERVSDVFKIDTDPTSVGGQQRAMISVASAWATHSGSSAATLKTAIHEALHSAGFRRPDGTSLT